MDKENRLIVITGANTGLGFEAAKNLLDKGFRVLMANRDEGKSKKAIEKLSSQGNGDKVEYLNLDLEDRTSIENFAAEFIKRNEKIDVLLNNAGVLLPDHCLSKNSLEKHFDINYLGHFYLNFLLKDSLSEQALVVSLGSLAHKMSIADIHFDDLSFKEREYTRMEAYSQSKLALTLFGVKLARHFEGSERRSVIAHPGVCNTDIIGRYYFKPLAQLVRPLVALYGIKGPQEGVRSVLEGILNKNIPNGSYIGPMGKKEWSGKPGLAQLSEKALDQKLADKLWSKSEEILGISYKI